MQRFFLIILIAAFAGCASTAPSEQAGFRREVDARFDLTAVRSFLRQLIQEHPSVDGVAIEESQVGDSWLIDESWLPVGLSSGDWTFQQSVGSKSEFELSYRADKETAVIFHCQSQRRGRFQVVSFGKEQLVTLTDCRIKT